MSRARDKANSTVSNFASTGIDDNADANAITIDSSENLNINQTSSTGGKLNVSNANGTWAATLVDAAENSNYVEFRDSSGNQHGYLKAEGAGLKLNVGSAGGIDFSANSHASGMTSELLDDYETGTFTPQLLGGTSNPSSTVSGSGEYVKVGKLVFIYIKFHNVNTTGASGYIRITGQPFNPSQTNGPLSMSSYDFDFSGRTSLTAEINNGEINGVTSGDDTGWGLLNFGAGASRYIFIAGTYRVA
jgi:hypothetical protein